MYSIIPFEYKSKASNNDHIKAPEMPLKLNNNIAGQEIIIESNNKVDSLQNSILEVRKSKEYSIGITENQLVKRDESVKLAKRPSTNEDASMDLLNNDSLEEINNSITEGDVKQEICINDYETNQVPKEEFKIDDLKVRHHSSNNTYRQKTQMIKVLKVHLKQKLMKTGTLSYQVSRVAQEMITTQILVDNKAKMMNL